ncbi:MAG: ArsB/NhaD family transporter [Frankiaceae bacterium]
MAVAVTVAVTVAIIGLSHRRALSGRFLVPAPTVVADPVLLRLGAVACIAMVPAFVAGVPVQWPAAAAAGALALAFARRRPGALRWSLLPWRLVLLVMGLFLAVTAAGEHGLDAALGHAAGTSGSGVGVLRTAVVGAGASNVVNNLPAYLAVERVADGSTTQLLGLLVGTNVGPLVTLWASLATLLWRDRCLARGVRIGAGRFALTGLAGLPLLLGGAWAALLATH